MDNTKKQVISGVKWTTIGTVVIALAALLKLSVLTRFLDKSDFGLMALVTFVLGFMNLFNDMGLTTAILYKKDVSKNEYSSLYWLNVFFSFVLYVIIFLLSSVIASFYNEPELEILISLLALNLIISAFGRLFKTIEAKNLSFKYISIFEIISAILSLILAIILAVNGFGVYSLVYSALGQYLLQNILYFLYGYNKYGMQLHFNFYETKPFLKIGVYQVGGQVLNLLNRDLDILIIGKFFSTEILGGYSLAKELVRRPISVLSPIINKVGAPTLARYNTNPLELKTNYLKLVSIVSSISFPFYIGVIIFAHFIVNLLYGDGFNNIIILVQILSVNMMFRFISGTVGNLVTATGKTNLEFYWNILNLIITPFVIYFASQYSIIMVASLVSLLSILLIYPSWLFFIKKLIDVSFMEYFKAFFNFSLTWLRTAIKSR